jgi:hypothetical protein
MSVEQRLRTDLHAVGKSIHPDPWAALGEVETTATTQQTRRTTILAVAASAALVLAGVLLGPTVADWLTGQSDVGPVDTVEQHVPPEWVQTLGVVEPVNVEEAHVWSPDGRIDLAVDALFIASGEDFRAVVEAAEDTGQPFPLAGPGFSMSDTDGARPDGYATAESVIGLHYTVTDMSGRALQWTPDPSLSQVGFVTGRTAAPMPHSLSTDRPDMVGSSSTTSGIVLLASDTPRDELRAAGALEWLANPNDQTDTAPVDPVRIAFAFQGPDGGAAQPGTSLVPPEQWGGILGVVELDQPAVWNSDGYTLAVDAVFIATGEDFRAAAQAAKDSDESFPLAGPGFTMIGEDGLPLTDITYYLDAETVVGLRYILRNTTEDAVFWMPDSWPTGLTLSTGQTDFVWLPHDGSRPTQPIEPADTHDVGPVTDVALYKSDTITADEVRQAGSLTWRTVLPDGEPRSEPDDWPHLTITYAD